MKGHLFLYILAAAGLRLFFAYAYYGSVDLDNAWYISQQFLKGADIYETTSYNHTPLWVSLQILSRYLSSKTNLPFYFLMKIYAIVADGVIGLLVYQISRSHFKLSLKSSLINSSLYLFSPVAILISSFHVQFDSIPIVFLLAAYVVLKVPKPKSFLSAFFLGIAAALKTWPFFLLPLYLIILKGELKEKAKFLLIVFATFFLPLLPYFLSGLKKPLEHIFLYFGTADFGLSVFLQFLVNDASVPFYTLWKYIFDYSRIFSLAMLALSFSLSYLMIIRRKMSFFEACVLVILGVYTFSLKLGAQYLLWVIPFAILTRYRKMTIVYTFITTVTLMANYQGHMSRAIYPTEGFKFLTIPILNLPWGITASIWWIVCLMWYLTILREDKVNTRRS